MQSFIDYLTHEKNYSTHTVLAYRRDLEAFREFISEVFDGAALREVNYAMVRSWVVALVDSGLENKTVNRKVSSLKSYYKFLLKTRQITENPLTKHKALKTPKTVQVPFSEIEIDKALQELSVGDDFDSLRNRAIVELFYATGMRKSELIELNLHSIDFSQSQVKVLGKRNKERILPLLPSVVATLQGYLRVRNTLEIHQNSREKLFLTKKGVKIGQTLVYRIINTYFSRVSEKAKCSPHILRHSFATHLLNQGADLNAVKELLGHASLASTQVYTYNSIDILKKSHAQAHPRSGK